MFEQTQAQGRRPWTVALSLSLQCAALGVLLLLPLLHPQAPGLLTLRPQVIRTWITQPPAPPVVHREVGGATAAALMAPVAVRPVFVLPRAPVSAVRTIEAPSVAEARPAVWSVPIGPSPVAAVVLPRRVEAQPPAPPETAVSGPLRVGGAQSAKLIFGPAPVYPPIAKAARSQGVVRLEAVIAADGGIRDLHVISGPPLLVAAATDAVRRWRYRPTLLNGVAVEVITEIEVTFSLTQR